jgi:transposase
LYVYRNKDVVEKCFDDLKNQLDMKRLRMHSSQTVEAKLFIQFIALIYTSALRNAIKSTDLDGKYTVRELLNEMSNITKITYSGKYGSIITEISKSQREIVQALQISID